MRCCVTTVTVIASFGLLGASGIVLADELTKEEMAVRDYSYEGIGVGTAEKEFLRLYPLAQQQESGKRNVTAWYAQLDRGQRVIQVECYQGRIFYMGVTFTPGMLFKIGGRAILEQKLTDTLGFPESVSGRMSHWHFARVDRKVGYRQALDGGAMLLIIDTAAERQRLAGQATDLDIGF
jgi:hypothetical protein